MKPTINHILFCFVVALCLLVSNVSVAQDTSSYISKIIRDSITSANKNYDTLNTLYDEEEDEDNIQVNPVIINDTNVFRQVNDTVVKSLQRKSEFEYANNPKYWKEDEPKEDSGFWLSKLFANDAFKWFFYLIVLGLFLFALYRIIVTNKLFLFYKSPQVALKEDEVLIQQDDLPELIEKAVVDKNYRLAIRYNYLYTLKQLNDRGLIEYHPEATNYTYVKRLANHQEATVFKYLTTIYEYVWYGEFFVDDEKYHQIVKTFKTFTASL